MRLLFDAVWYFHVFSVVDLWQRSHGGKANRQRWEYQSCIMLHMAGRKTREKERETIELRIMWVNVGQCGSTSKISNFNQNGSKWFLAWAHKR